MNLKRISASCFCLLLAGQMTLSAQNVSFSSNKVTLKSAFEKIEKESKYKIAYNSHIGCQKPNTGVATKDKSINCK